MSELKNRLSFVHRIEAPDSWEEVLRRVDAAPSALPRGRFVRVAAAAATAAIFVALVVWAGVELGAHRPSPPLSTSGAWNNFWDPSSPWTFRYPAGWTVTSTGADPAHAPRDSRFKVKVTRTVLSSVPVSLTGLSVGPNTGDTPEVVALLGDSAAVVIIDRLWSDYGNPSPGVTETPMSALRELPQNPGWRYSEHVIVRPDGRFTVTLWFGPNTNASDVANAQQVANSVQLTPVERWMEAGARDTLVLHDLQDGFTVAFPSGWYLADQNLTPLLSDPHEILSVGSYPLRPGEKAPTDAYLPGNAIADLGPDDVFVTIQTVGSAHGFPARPTSFGPPAACASGSPSCLRGDDLFRTLPNVHAWWIPFEDAGHGYYAMVAMGSRAFQDPSRSQAAWDVLDSLAFSQN